METVKKFKIIFILCAFIFLSVYTFADYPLGDTGIPSDYYDTMLFDNYDGSIVLPSAFSWKTKSKVTPAKDQQSCRSCWAFAATGAFESKLMIAGLREYDLSEQQQVSCNFNMFGCNGGNMTCLRFWYNTGPIEERCTGYSATNSPCSNYNSCSQLPFRTTGYYTVNTRIQEDIKTSLIKDGPTYFRFDVYSDFYTFWFNGKTGEAYAQTSRDYKGGHAVLIIGWDDTKGAWLCKNSWGKNGGPNNDGTFWIKYDGHNRNLRFGMANIHVTGFSNMDTIKGNWHFENNTRDSSGYSNSGTLMNGASYSTGIKGKGLMLDGINDYVRINNYSAFNDMDSFTIAAWIYPTAIKTNNSIISKVNPNRDFNLKLTKYGKLEVHFAHGASYYKCISTNTIPLNSWSHVAASWTGTSWELYYNGSKIMTANHAGKQPKWTGTRMGIGTMNYSEVFTGKIDAVKVFGSALTNSEVIQLYYRSPPLKYESENNDVYYLADGPIAPGVLVEGVKEESGSIDWFYFDVDTIKPFDFYLRGPYTSAQFYHNSNLSSCVNSFSDGEWQKYGKYYTFVPKKNGRYYIKITGYPNFYSLRLSY